MDCHRDAPHDGARGDQWLHHRGKRFAYSKRMGMDVYSTLPTPRSLSGVFWHNEQSSFAAIYHRYQTIHHHLVLPPITASGSVQRSSCSTEAHAS